MNLVSIFILIPLLAIVLIPFLSLRGKAITSYCTIFFITLVSSIVAIKALSGQTFDYTLEGSLVSGLVRIQVDALSAWFMLIINFSFLTGGFYGLFYMNALQRSA